MISGQDVSVIVPCYNAQAYLEQALESILNQTVAPAEIIVVDDGSDDHSAEVARSVSSRIQVVQQANQGCAAARNAGAALAKGTWLAFLDSDDTWTPDSLELRIRSINSDPEARVVFGAVEQYICPEIDPERAERFELPEGINTARAAGSMLIEVSTFNSIGGFDTEFRHAEMMDFSTRLDEAGFKVMSTNDLLLRRRIHGGNKVLQKNAFKASVLRVLRNAAKRRKTG